MPLHPPGIFHLHLAQASESTPPPSQYRPGPRHRLNQASRSSSLPPLPQPSHLLPTIRSPQRRHCASCQTSLWPGGTWSSDVPGVVGKTAAAWEQRGPRLPTRGGAPIVAPPPSPAPQPGFLWVRPWGGRCLLAPRTHQDRQGRSQRAASPHPEEPAAPEGAQLADCTTAQVGSSAPHHPGFLEATEAEDSHDCARVGVGGTRDPPGSPADGGPLHQLPGATRGGTLAFPLHPTR